MVQKKKKNFQHHPKPCPRSHPNSNHWMPCLCSASLILPTSVPFFFILIFLNFRPVLSFTKTVVLISLFVSFLVHFYIVTKLIFVQPNSHHLFFCLPRIPLHPHNDIDTPQAGISDFPHPTGTLYTFSFSPSTLFSLFHHPPLGPYFLLYLCLHAELPSWNSSSIFSFLPIF